MSETPIFDGLESLRTAVRQTATLQGRRDKNAEILAEIKKQVPKPSSAVARFIEWLEKNPN